MAFESKVAKALSFWTGHVFLASADGSFGWEALCRASAMPRLGVANDSW